MTEWLIDDCGVLWPATSPQLRGTLWSALPAAEFTKYAVENLGFVHLSHGRSGLRIAWRPTFLSEYAYAGLLLALGEAVDGRVAVATLQQDWDYRVCASIAAATAYVVDVFKCATSDNEGFFEVRRCRPEHLRQLDELGRLVAARELTRQEMGALEFWSFLENHSNHRYVLVEAPTETKDLRLVTWGRGYRRFEDTMFSKMADDSFENQPDRAYARAVATGYRQVLESGEARCEQVLTSTWWPGRGRKTVRYTRLLMPVRIKGRGSCVLSTAQSIEVIEPSLKAHHEAG